MKDVSRSHEHREFIVVNLVKVLLIVGAFCFGLFGFQVFIMAKSAVHETVAVLALGFCGLFIGQLGQIIAVQNKSSEVKSDASENKGFGSNEKVEPKF